MPHSVAVIGGGIGGLTAAHELIERGFDVTGLVDGDVEAAVDQFVGGSQSADSSADDGDAVRHSCSWSVRA